MKSALGIIYSALVHLFCGIFFQGTWQHKCKTFKNSWKASWATQNSLAGHMRAAC